MRKSGVQESNSSCFAPLIERTSNTLLDGAEVILSEWYKSIDWTVVVVKLLLIQDIINDSEIRV